MCNGDQPDAMPAAKTPRISVCRGDIPGRARTPPRAYGLAASYEHDNVAPVPSCTAFGPAGEQP